MFNGFGDVSAFGDSENRRSSLKGDFEGGGKVQLDYSSGAKSGWSSKYTPETPLTGPSPGQAAQGTPGQSAPSLKPLGGGVLPVTCKMLDHMGKNGGLLPGGIMKHNELDLSSIRVIGWVTDYVHKGMDISFRLNDYSLPFGQGLECLCNCQASNNEWLPDYMSTLVDTTKVDYSSTSNRRLRKQVVLTGSAGLNPNKEVVMRIFHARPVNSDFESVLFHPAQLASLFMNKENRDNGETSRGASMHNTQFNSNSGSSVAPGSNVHDAVLPQPLLSKSEVDDIDLSNYTPDFDLDDDTELLIAKTIVAVRLQDGDLEYCHTDRLVKQLKYLNIDNVEKLIMEKLDSCALWAIDDDYTAGGALPKKLFFLSD